MKSVQKIFAALLVVLVLISVLPMTAQAAQENTPKEEVVYINLNTDGSVKEIYVVNIFDLDTKGQIIDYGRYETLRNMTSTDEIGYANEKITIDAEAGKLYYEGKLSSNVMPWNIAIHYYMNGTEYSAREIAGKSGDLKITLSITDNTSCVGNFFEGFALQAAVTLDTKKCTQIKADGATVANVGSQKQLTYTILPNKGANIEITAKVTDFEMSGITINGITLNLDIEIDNEAIKDKLSQIVNAVRDLNDGAGKLNEGAEELYDGTSLLKDKVGSLTTGVGALTTGTGNLSNGLSAITDKNKELLDGAYMAFQGFCSAAETMLNAELTKNGLSTIHLTPETYAKVLRELLNAMDADNVYEQAYRQALAEVTSQVMARQEELYKGYIEQNADMIYMTYLQSIENTLYSQVVSQIIYDFLISGGFNETSAKAYLQSPEGAAAIAQKVAELTTEQKEEILAAAAASLTDEQKKQIRDGALTSLTEDQKKQIRDGYIEQVMKSKEVTDQITAAVSKANSAAAQVTDLMAQLDSYSLFYEGLKSYTAAVSEAAAGANTLKINMQTLYDNVGALKTAVGTLNSGAKELYDGTTQLKEGAEEFLKQTGGLDSMVDGEIGSLIVSATGGNVKLTSFVSQENTNINAVQFVIKTDAIEKEIPAVVQPVVKEKLNFWQKLLRLFGLY